MQLILPSRKYLSSYYSAIDEYRANDVRTYAFLNPDRYDVLQRMASFRTGEGLPAHYVRADYLWLIDGDSFVGEVSIRHRLTDSLLRYGGHIGYGVRFSRWGQGIGTTMLSMALTYAKDNLHLERVLITCDDDNIASARVIEKNGGVLQDKIPNTINNNDIVTRRYWINNAQ